MAVLYLGGASFVLLVFWKEIPAALALVFEHAFTPVAATGGFLGATVREAFRFGVARGVYSNEAGTGSVPIAHASARTNDPVRQGKISMLGVFLDTLVVSSATGLVVLVNGAWTSGLDSTALTAMAFTEGMGPIGGKVVLAGVAPVRTLHADRLGLLWRAVRRLLVRNGSPAAVSIPLLPGHPGRLDDRSAGDLGLG